MKGMKKKQWFAFGFVALMLVMLAASAYAAHTHNWGAWKTITNPTCLKEGKQERVCQSNVCSLHERRSIAKLPHNYSAATCTKLAKCTSGCGQTTGSLRPHSYSAATCVKKATCTACGATTGSLGAHRFSAATCTKPSTCTVCKSTVGTALGHNWVNYECTRCGWMMAR